MRASARGPLEWPRDRVPAGTCSVATTPNRGPAIVDKWCGNCPRVGILRRWDARNQRVFDRERDAFSDEAWLEDLRLARSPLPGTGSLWQRWRAWLRRENARTRSYVREPNELCPICARPVVAEPLARPWFSGRMFTPRTRAELEAACPVHGRAPFNTATRRFEMQRDFPGHAIKRL